MSEANQSEDRVSAAPETPGYYDPVDRPGSGHYVKEVGYEQAKFVATAMDHAGLLDWESEDHDKQTACAVAIAAATRFILGVRGFIAINAQEEPEQVDDPEAETKPYDDGSDILKTEPYTPPFVSSETTDYTPPPMSTLSSADLTVDQDRPQPHPEQVDDPSLPEKMATAQASTQV